MQKIKLALIGYGNHSKKIWLPTILKSNYFDLVAISSESSIIQFQRELKEACSDIKLFSNHESLICNSGAEALLISSANHSHAQLTIKGLEKNKHILCEKPLCFGTEDAKKIEALSQSSKSLLSTGFMYRHHPQWSYLKANFNLTRDNCWRLSGSFQYPLKDPQNYRFHKNGGGALLDCGCYFLDICEYLELTRPSLLKVSSKKNEEGVDLYTHFYMEFAAGQIADFFCSAIHPYFQKFEHHSSLGTTSLTSPFIVAKGQSPLGTFSSRSAKIKQLKFDAVDCYLKQLETFGESIFAKKLSSELSSGLSNAFWLSQIINEQQINV